MSHVLLIESPDQAVTMTVTAPLVHLCPVVEETDHGSITIVWTARRNTYELHSLADYLAQFATVTISHEALTERIANDLGVVIGITVLSVVTTWDTAGLVVTCST